MIKRFFSSDDSYKEMISKYTTIDGILAIALYILLLLVYYFMGVLFVQRQIYLGVPINLLLIVFCIVLVLVRKQKLASIGFTLYGVIKRDIPAVLVVGFLFYAMHLPFQMPVNGMQINPINMTIMVVLHFVINFLYRKYNSLAAPTAFHGLLDWGGNLLQ